MLFYFAVFAIASASSFVLTRLVRAKAVARGWVSRPDSGRHIHSIPLPRLGGVAVALAFFAACLFLGLVQHFGHGWATDLTSRAALSIMLGSLIVLLIGTYDDIRGLGPYTKLLGESIAGLILFVGGLRFLHLGIVFGTRQIPWFVDLPLTLFWVLAITNAFNLIDGIDGLAAGSALFCAVAAFIVALVNHSLLTSLMTMALSGAILGFLHYNFTPATIFLGDSGSLFIGFVLSALALQSAEKAPTMLAVAIPVVSFGLPILETVLSVLRRWIAGRPVLSADQEHIHHKLLARGFSQRQVVTILYGVSALFGLLSLFLLWPSGGAIGIVFVVLGSGIWIGVQHLGYLEFGELRRIAQRTIDQRRVFVNNLALRRAIEELRRVNDYHRLYGALVSAFDENDFDGFELRLQPPTEWLPGSDLDVSNHLRPSVFRWKKPASPGPTVDSWRMILDLPSIDGGELASLLVYRHYGHIALHVDVNLLTSELPGPLAEALDRARRTSVRRLTTFSRKPADTAVSVVEEAS